MAQYKAGTVTVTNGSNIVVGAGTTWISNVEAGDWFKVYDLSPIYPLAGDPYLDGGFEKFQITVNYAGVSASGLSYCIVTDFSPLGFPYMFKGDINPQDIWNKAMGMIEPYTSVAGWDIGLAPPTQGYHDIGFIRWNTNPVAGENIGWVCTVAGTPGTFNAWGVISL